MLLLFNRASQRLAIQAVRRQAPLSEYLRRHRIVAPLQARLLTVKIGSTKKKLSNDKSSNKIIAPYPGRLRVLERNHSETIRGTEASISTGKEHLIRCQWYIVNPIVPSCARVSHMSLPGNSHSRTSIHLLHVISSPVNSTPA